MTRMPLPQLDATGYKSIVAQGGVELLKKGQTYKHNVRHLHYPERGLVGPAGIFAMCICPRSISLDICSRLR